jgi:hypothetical protein
VRASIRIVVEGVHDVAVERMIRIAREVAMPEVGWLARQLENVRKESEKLPSWRQYAPKPEERPAASKPKPSPRPLESTAKRRD